MGLFDNITISKQACAGILKVLLNDQTLTGSATEPEPQPEPTIDDYLYLLEFYMVGRPERSDKARGPNQTQVKCTINNVSTVLDNITPPTNAWKKYSYYINIYDATTITFENILETDFGLFTLDLSNAIANVSLMKNGVNYIKNGNFMDPDYDKDYINIDKNYVYYPSQTNNHLTNWSGRYIIVKNRSNWGYPSSNDNMIVSLQNNGSNNFGVLEQTINLVNNSPPVLIDYLYTLQFYMVGRSDKGRGPNTTQVKYTVNGKTIIVDTITPLTNKWTLYEYIINFPNPNLDNLTITFENILTNSGDLSNAIANVSLMKNGVNYIKNGNFMDPDYDKDYINIDKNYVYYPSQTNKHLTNWSGRYIIVKNRSNWGYPSSNDNMIVSLQNDGSNNFGVLEQTIDFEPRYFFNSTNKNNVLITRNSEAVKIDNNSWKKLTPGTYIFQIYPGENSNNVGIKFVNTENINISNFGFVMSACGENGLYRGGDGGGTLQVNLKDGFIQSSVYYVLYIGGRGGDVPSEFIIDSETAFTVGGGMRHRINNNYLNVIANSLAIDGGKGGQQSTGSDSGAFPSNNIFTYNDKISIQYPNPFGGGGGGSGPETIDGYFSGGIGGNSGIGGTVQSTTQINVNGLDGIYGGGGGAAGYDGTNLGSPGKGGAGIGYLYFIVSYDK